MIKLASKLKKNDKAGEDGNNQGGGRRGNSAPVKSFLIRDRLLLKESQEMHDNLPSSCKVHYFNPNELHRFELIIVPDESYWKGGRFRFVVEVPEEYNFSPPKVKCQTRIWHPNITEDGDICLSLLRESAIDGMGWAPTRTLKDVIWGLNSLFTDLLNFEDSLNHEAAEHYHQNPTEFQHKVRDYLYRYAKN